MTDSNPNTPTSSLATKEELERRNLELEYELKKKQLADFGKPPAASPKSWWVIVVEFLGIPAAVIGLAVGITTASGNRATEAKTVAETVQIKAAMSKAAETEKLASDLSTKQKEGPRAFEQAVTQNAEQIKDALERLQTLEEQSARVNVQRSVLKFVLLWILFNIVGLGFDVLGSVWGTATSTVIYTLMSFFPKMLESREGKPPRLFPAVVLILGQVPNILKWSIQLSIFVTLLGPLFNEIAVSFGSQTTFADVLAEAKHLHFGAMLSAMRQLLFG